jgi:hypothetical protein
MKQWIKVPSVVLPNLRVLKHGVKEVGFIEKPRDTRTDKNSWRCWSGIGEQAKFVGHAETEEQAMANVQQAVAR